MLDYDLIQTSLLLANESVEAEVIQEDQVRGEG